jgi:hypothetical protein
MKYAYTIDYVGITDDSETATRGIVSRSFPHPMTADDLDRIRIEILGRVRADWKKDHPMNRNCPVVMIGISHVWGGAES